MPQLGPLEILVIFVVALLVFGPNRLPEIARQVGRGFQELRRIQDHVRHELDDALREPPPPSTPSPAPELSAGPAAESASDHEEPAGAPPPAVEADTEGPSGANGESPAGTST